MKFRGDRVADFDKDTGNGLVGKVVGPNVNGQYFVITQASYDAESDTTFAEAQALPDPRQVLERGQV